MHRVYQSWVLVRTETSQIFYTQQDMLDLTFMRIAALVFIGILTVLTGCRSLPDGSSMDHATALRLSDSYMSDLVSDRVNLALDKMEPQFVQAAGGKQKPNRDFWNCLIIVGDLSKVN